MRSNLAHLLLRGYRGSSLLVLGLVLVVFHKVAPLPLFAILATFLFIYSVASLFVQRPVQSILLGYILALALTGFIAGIGIENGGFLNEVGLAGEATGAFARLLPFYGAFLASFMLAWRWIPLSAPEGKRNPIEEQEPLILRTRVRAAFALTACLVPIAAGIYVGYAEGFAFLKGVNRYLIRNEATGFKQDLFNLYLNNRVFIAFVLGMLIYSPRWKNRVVASSLLICTVALSVLHGEQFMATLQLCLAVLIPIVFMQSRRGRIDTGRIISAAALAFLVGTVSIYFAYVAQGFDVLQMFGLRVLLQGQLWYVVDADSSTFFPPALGGWPAVSRFVSSLGDLQAPNFEDVSGLRELMYVYGSPDILSIYSENNVTFTMGQIAVPVFWFGHLGGLIFVCGTAAAYALASKIVIRSLNDGGIATIWIAAKLYTVASFALQQGEYWSLFSIRTALFFLGALFMIHLTAPRR